MSKIIKEKDESYAFDAQNSQGSEIAYDVISFQKRVQLIECVCVHGNSVPKAAEIMGINTSTAKYIVRCYKKKGIIMKKFDQQILDLTQAQKIVKNLKERIKESSMVRKLKKRQNKEKKLRKTTEKTCQEIKLKEEQINNEGSIPTESQSKNITIKKEEIQEVQQKVQQGQNNLVIPPVFTNEALFRFPSPYFSPYQLFVPNFCQFY